MFKGLGKLIHECQPKDFGLWDLGDITNSPHLLTQNVPNMIKTMKEGEKQIKDG